MPALKERTFRHGERVVAAGGKLAGASLAGVSLQVVRDEECRKNSESGRDEPMVMGRVVSGDGELGALVDVPRRRLVGGGASRVGWNGLYGRMFDRIFRKRK